MGTAWTAVPARASGLLTWPLVSAGAVTTVAALAVPAAVVSAASAVVVCRRRLARRERVRLRKRLPITPDRARPAPSDARRAGGTGRGLASVADRCARGVGRWLRSRGRRPADPAADRWLGWAVLAGATTVPVAGLWGGALVAAVVGAAPVARARGARRRRSAAVVAQIPDAIDLLRLAVDSGLDVGTALVVVVDHTGGDGEVAVALRRIRQRVARGDRLVDAVTELESLGEPARQLHEALAATQRHGVPLVPALERAGDDGRDLRRRHREEAARSLPVKLLFPLVFCTLPALVLLTVVPLLVRSFPSLTL